MWVLVQKNEDGSKVKYLSSIDYDKIIDYINRFGHIKKYSDYKFIHHGSNIIYFNIYLGEELK